MPSISSLKPHRAVAGGRVTLQGQDFPIDDLLPGVSVGGVAARIAFATSQRLVITMPSDLEGGPAPIRVAGLPGDTPYVSIGGVWATGLHQVDSPAFDSHGNLFVTYSGARGQGAPVSIFRVTTAGTREPYASGIVNPTSMAFGPDGQLYVSSRFEGAVYRVSADGTYEQVASDLGVACGLAFDAEGWMYVGDRSGTIFRVRDGRATAFASLPPSVAAFHLAMRGTGELFVTAPTLGTYDYVYRIDRHGNVRTLGLPMGRPQGLAFGPDDALYVVDALAGSSGLFRIPIVESGPDAEAEIVAAGAALVGVAWGPSGELVVTSNDTAYRFD